MLWKKDTLLTAGVLVAATSGAAFSDTTGERVGANSRPLDWIRPSVPEGRWVGTLDRADARWWVELEVEFPPSEGENGLARIHLPGSWRSNLETELSPTLSAEVESGWSTDSIPGLGVLELRPGFGRLAAHVVSGPAAGAEGVLRPARRPTIREERIVFGSAEVRIAGRLLLSDSLERSPAVVVVPGAGNSSVDGNPEYRFWGEFLAARGFVVLLFDKRGVGDSEGSWRTVGFGERADDLASAVDLLASDGRVDSDRIAALSFSQGGWVAVEAAGRGVPFDHLIQVSAPSVRPFDADLVPAKAAFRAAGGTEAQWVRYVDLLRLDVRARMNGDAGPVWDSLVVSVERMNRESGALPSPYTLGVRASPARLWYGNIAYFDPGPILERMGTPALWIYGDSDTQSDVERNVEALRELGTRRGAPYDVLRFPGAGHGVDRPTRTDPPQYLSPPEFLEAVLRRLFERAGCGVEGDLARAFCT